MFYSPCFFLFPLPLSLFFFFLQKSERDIKGKMANIFSHSAGCHFVLLTVSFALQKLLTFRRSHLLIVNLSLCYCVMFRKQSPVSIPSRVPPTFFSKRFSVAGFMLRSLILLDLSFVHGDRHGSMCSPLHTIIQLCQHHLLKMLSSLHCMFYFLSKVRIL